MIVVDSRKYDASKTGDYRPVSVMVMISRRASDVRRRMHHVCTVVCHALSNRASDQLIDTEMLQ